MKGKSFLVFFFLIIFTKKRAGGGASVVKATKAELKERNCFLVSFPLFAEDSFPILGTQPESVLFNKATLPSVGNVAYLHSADQTDPRINCSTLLSKIGGKL